jgi:hypothetical protein
MYTDGVKQVREVVPVEEWVESAYFAGPVTKMFPFWKEKIIQAYSKDVNEVIVIGSIGSGKTTFANALLMRRIYELSCFEPVEALFKLLPGTRVSFMYFTVTLRQASWTGFGMLRDMIDVTPYFKEIFRRDKEIDTEIRFPKMSVYSGSEVSHQLGLALLGAVLDEANFLKAKDPLKKAQDLYSSTVERRKSRFIVEGKDRGLSVLVSSAENPSSFVEERIKKVSKYNDSLIISAVGYELKSKQYSGDKFVVFVGNEFIAPKIINGVEDLAEVMHWFRVDESVIEEIKKMPVRYSIKNVVPDEYRIYFKEVPVEFQRAFDDDIYRAIKDTLGISMGGDDKLFKSFIAYDEALYQDDRFFSSDVIVLSSKDEIKLQDKFNINAVKNRHIPRYIHIDLGLKGDRTGMSCAMVDGTKKTEVGTFPIVKVEWMVGIEKNKGYIDDEVPLWKIREFLVWLRDSGVNVVKISFDTFQSADMIQILQRRGFQVERLSVDRTDEAYRNLVSLYLERRIKHQENLVYRKELFSLNWDGKKVDHPQGGSKDIADGVAGSVLWAVTEWKQGVYELTVENGMDRVIEEAIMEERFGQYKVDGWDDFFHKWGDKERFQR